jgi:beta-galactosidase
MKRRTFCAILPIAAAQRPADGAGRQQPPRERLLFDRDWKFLQGDPGGAEAISYDAAAWRSIDVPHDWSIEGKIDPQSPMAAAVATFPPA